MNEEFLREQKEFSEWANMELKRIQTELKESGRATLVSIAMSDFRPLAFRVASLKTGNWTEQSDSTGDAPYIEEGITSSIYLGTYAWVQCRSKYVKGVISKRIPL